MKITDSLNREINFEYDVQDVYPYGLCDKITYKGFGGAARTIRISYKSLGNVLRGGYSLQTGRQLFPNIYSPPPAYPEGFLTYQLAESQFNPDKVAAVWLPDGVRSYQFRYNSHGELARVELPTGGATEYNWVDARNLGSGLISEFDHFTDDDVYRRVVERRIYANASTLDSKTILGGPEWSSDMRGYVLEDQQDGNGTLLTRAKHHYYGIYERNSSNIVNLDQAVPFDRHRVLPEVAATTLAIMKCSLGYDQSDFNRIAQTN